MSDLSSFIIPDRVDAALTHAMMIGFTEMVEYCTVHIDAMEERQSAESDKDRCQAILYGQRELLKAQIYAQGRLRELTSAIHHQP